MPDSVEYNLFTRFHFKNQPGVGQMKATGGAFQGLYKNAKMAQAGVRQIGTGFRQLSMVGVGAIAVLGGVVKRGMEFGKAWSDARAVLRGAPKDVDALREKAKHLGATTLYTAAQAAQGMEELARAGLDAKRVALAIRPVLKLSVADNVELAQSAKIVAGAMNQFKDQISDVEQVTDTFAYVSRNSMTNTTELGEAFKYAGPAARLAGQSFYELMGTLGLLAQANVRGSLAGTAYKNAVVKLAKGGRTANKVFGGKQAFLNAVTDKKTGKWKSFSEIMLLTMKKLSGIKNDAERAGLAFKLFGLRGITTFGAFKEAGSEDFANLITNIRKQSKGTAEEMARIKQQSLHGQWLLFKSALDGVALALYDIIKPSVISAVKMASGTLSDLAAAFKLMTSGASETKVAKRYGTTIAGIAFGIKEAFFEVGQTLKSVGKTIFGILAKITGDSKLNAKKITKLVTKFVLFAAVLVPIIATVAAAGLAFGGMFNIVSGGLKVISAMTSKWGLAFLAITYAFAGGQKKGESFVVTMVRGLKKMVALANQLLWPFKMLAKHLGTIPALMAGIMTYKAGKGLMARAGGAMSGSRNPLVRMLGGAVGGGLPVFVTNWPAGGLGGGLPGTAAGAGTAAAGASWLTRAGLALGGSSGAMTAALGGSKWAVLGSGLGTAGMALGAFAAALAPAVAGVSALGKAYDPAYQKELRNKLMKEHYTKRNSELKAEIKKGVRDEFGYRKDTQYVYDQRWQKIQRMKRWGGTMTGQDVGAGEYMQARQSGKGMEYLDQKFFPFMKQMTRVAKAGRAAWAHEQLYKTGMLGEVNKWMKSPDAVAALQKSGFSQEQIDILRNMQKLSEEQVRTQAKGQTIYIQLDGKNIAVATATYRNESRERAGRIPTGGARRRAMTRGTD